MPISLAAHWALMMEFVAGQTLYDFFESRNSRLAIDEACRCIRQAMVGLQHAHERGLGTSRSEAAEPDANA